MSRSALATALLLVSSCCTAAASECAGPATRWQLCSRCTFETFKRTKRDTPCEIPISLGSAADVLLSQHLVSRPSHGVAGQSGSAYAYSPAKGFVGQDNFKMERVFLKGSAAYVTYMIVHMEVVP